MCQQWLKGLRLLQKLRYGCISRHICLGRALREREREREIHCISCSHPKRVRSLLAGKVAAATGAAVLSKAVFAQNHHVSKVEYDEYGPSYIHRKCFS